MVDKSSLKKYLLILDFYLCYLFIQTPFKCQEDLHESLTTINGGKNIKIQKCLEEVSSFSQTSDLYWQSDLSKSDGGFYVWHDNLCISTRDSWN